MISRLEVLLTPAEFATLPSRDLRNSACVVFDVLRATSTLIEALANGATSVLPVADIDAALRQRDKNSQVLLAGERNGLRIRAIDASGVEFDLGNSPGEFTRERVAGRPIVMTTTNGTRALDACSGAATVLAASFSNLGTTVRWLRQCHLPQAMLIGAGTRDHSAWEDALAVGALVNQLWDLVGDCNRQTTDERSADRGSTPTSLSHRRLLIGEGRGEGSLESSAGQVASLWLDDSARVVREVYLARSANLVAALGEGRNGRRLLGIPELAADVAFCAKVDRHDFVVLRGRDGALRRESVPS